MYLQVTEQIIPTSKQNGELFQLLRTSTLQKLISSRKLVKVREEKMQNPSIGKEDLYMIRHKLKFAKFYTANGHTIFVDRFKKLLQSEQNLQQVPIYSHVV